MKRTFYIVGIGTFTFTRGTRREMVYLRMRSGSTFSLFRSEFNELRGMGRFGFVN